VVEQDIAAAAHIVRQTDVAAIGIPAADQIVGKGLSDCRPALDLDGFIRLADEGELLDPRIQQAVAGHEPGGIHVGEVFQGQAADEVVAVGPDDRIGQCGFLGPLQTAVAVETAVEVVVGVHHRRSGLGALIDVGRDGSRFEDEPDALLAAAHVCIGGRIDCSLERELSVLDRGHAQRVTGLQVDEPDFRSVIGRVSAVDRIMPVRAGEAEQAEGGGEPDSFYAHDFLFSGYEVNKSVWKAGDLCVSLLTENKNPCRLTDRGIAKKTYQNT